MTTRRDFLATTGAAALVAAIPASAATGAPTSRLQTLSRQYLEAYETHERDCEAVRAMERQSPYYAEFERHLSAYRRVWEGFPERKSSHEAGAEIRALRAEGLELEERYKASLPPSWAEADERSNESLDARWQAFDAVMEADAESLTDLAAKAAVFEIESGTEAQLDDETARRGVALIRDARRLLPLPEGFFANTRFS